MDKSYILDVLAVNLQFIYLKNIFNHTLELAVTFPIMPKLRVMGVIV